MTPIERDVEEFQKIFLAVEQEVGSVIVGLKDVIRRTVGSLFIGGHVLLEGAPGLGKTLLIKTISQTLGLSCKRIQFTPDLMPSDMTGTQVLTEREGGKREFVFKPGPLFTNIVLADEINRTTPKTQAALLEAMEERQITVLDTTYKLPDPFFVMATQNPIELEGTYPLPEAQLDRFIVKLLVPTPTPAELKEILTRTTSTQSHQVHPLLSQQDMHQFFTMARALIRRVVVPDNLTEALVRLVSAINPTVHFAPAKVKKYVRFGPGPRGAQAVMLTAKVAALRDGRMNLSIDDIRASFIASLRHRVILNFEAEAEGVSSDMLLEELRDAK